MKKRLFAALFTLIFAISLVGCGAQVTENSQTDSTLSESQETIASQEITSNNNFENKETVSSTKTDSNSDALSQSNSVSSKSNASKTNSSSASNIINSARAKAIAFDAAGVKESNVRDLEIDIDFEKGVKVYDISFETDEYEYEFYIDIESGKIVNADREPTDVKNTQSKQTQTAGINEKRAQEIAFEAADVNAKDVYDFEFETDIEKGVKVYEISFKKGNVEYSFEINATNGNIIKFDREFDD